MVTEMTALAGIMGRHYAQKEGLQPEVAQARSLLHTPTPAGARVDSISGFVSPRDLADSSAAGDL